MKDNTNIHCGSVERTSVTHFYTNTRHLEPKSRLIITFFIWGEIVFN
jgi:hypothetical protein